MIIQFRKSWIVFVAVLLLLVSFSVSAKEQTPSAVELRSLPREAQATLALIKRGGPFAYNKDGAVFGNFEGVLPKQKRGYYHEYTVKTPGIRGRGARRIVSGGELVTPHEHYYTPDHYKTFKRIKE